MRFAIPLILLAAAPAFAEQDGRVSWDGTLYGYATRTSLRADSVLDPGNRLARLVQASDTAELRMNLKAENEAVRLTARPIVSVREQRNAFGAQAPHEGYLSQWQLRVRVAEGWNVAAGREVFNWGAGQFRSPSSPYYFDNGRSDPMRELSGMDNLKVAWTPDVQHSVTLAHIVRSGHAAQPDQWRDSWLMKLDLRGEAWASGAVAAKAQGVRAFLGAHAQYTASDMLLLYGELGSSARPSALVSPADMAQPFALQAVSPRRTSALAGASYTFEDGRSLAVEYLHDGYGYTTAEASAYFSRAAASPLSAGMALAYAPRLLGRDYLHMVWQSNLMESDEYWRLMYTHNVTDGSDQVAAYGETALNTHLSAFAMLMWNVGNARQELPALLTRSATLGLKVVLP